MEMGKSACDGVCHAPLFDMWAARLRKPLACRNLSRGVPATQQRPQLAGAWNSGTENSCHWGSAALCRKKLCSLALISCRGFCPISLLWSIPDQIQLLPNLRSCVEQYSKFRLCVEVENAVRMHAQPTWLQGPRSWRTRRPNATRRAPRRPRPAAPPTSSPRRWPPSLRRVSCHLTHDPFGNAKLRIVLLT